MSMVGWYIIKYEVRPVGASKGKLYNELAEAVKAVQEGEELFQVVMQYNEHEKPIIKHRVTILGY